MAYGNAGPDWLMEMSRYFADWRNQGVGVETMVAIQRKNLEALSQAQQVAIEGVHAVMRHQLAFAQRAVADCANLFTGLAAPNGSMQDRLAQHADVSKSTFEKGLSNMREMTDIVTKANAEAINVLTRRMSESFDEIRDLAGGNGRG